MTDAAQGTTLWYLGNLEFFQDLRESGYHSLERNSKLVSWAKGQSLSNSLTTDRVYFIVKGRIEISTYQVSGKKLINDYVGEGGVLGWNASSPGLVYSSAAQEAVAFEDTEAVVYDREYFAGMMERRPSVAVSLLRYMGLRQQRIEFRLRSILFRTNLCKVAGVILELAESYGIRSEGKIIIESGLSQEDIGAMVGLSREEVTRALTQLRREGFISNHRRRIEIIDSKGLEELLE
ncbi:N/A [soil metagenome]